MDHHQVNWTLPSLRQLASMKIGGRILLKTVDPVSLDRNSQTHSLVVKEILQLKFPQALKEYLITITESMRKTMMTWLSYMLDKWRLMVGVQDYIDHTHWTSRGDIDTAETVRSLYFAKKIILRARRGTFAMITTYCLEDCIDDFWPRVKELNTDRLNAMIDDWKRKREVLPLYWWYRKQNDLNGLIQYFEATTELTRNFYNNRLSIERNMFALSVHSGSYAATKHFWESLDSHDRFSALQTLKKSNELERTKSYKFMDLNMFLWSENCRHGISRYLRRMMVDMNLGCTLTAWPWQDVFLSTLSEMIDDFELKDYKQLAQTLLSALGSHKTQVRCFEFFVEVWTKCPDRVKRKLNYHDLFTNVIEKHGDIKTVNYIVNDKIWRDNRRKILIVFCDAWWHSAHRSIVGRHWLQQIDVSEEEKGLIREYIDGLHQQT